MIGTLFLVDKYEAVSKWFHEAFSKWQYEEKEFKKLVDFANELEITPGSLGHYMNRRRIPTREVAERIADKLHDRSLLDILGYSRSDPLLQYIIANWDKLPPDKQFEFKRLIDEAGQGDHLENNRTSMLRRT